MAGSMANWQHGAVDKGAGKQRHPLYTLWPARSALWWTALPQRSSAWFSELDTQQRCNSGGQHVPITVSISNETEPTPAAFLLPQEPREQRLHEAQRAVERLREGCGSMEAVALAGTYLVLSGTGGCGDSWRPAASSVGTESRAKESFMHNLMSLRCPAQDPMRQPNMGLWRPDRHPM